MTLIWVGLGAAVLLSAAAVWRQMRRRGLDRWLVPYLLQTPKRQRPRKEEDIHLILCVADHHEPKSDRATPERAWARIERWTREYPRQLGRFRDSDGRPPRHTFFYPMEEYEAAHVDALNQ